MNRLEAVSLDVTGTLIHCPRMGEIYSEVLGHHGVEVSPAQVRATFPVVWQELDCLTPTGHDRFSSFPGGARAWWGRLIERLCELLDAGMPSPFARAELFSRFEKPESWEIYPDTKAALDRLAASGARLAVLSNFDERLPLILDGLGLSPRFEIILPSAEVGLAKPNPGFFHLLLERLAVVPGSAAHIGNSPREDVEGATAAGVEGVLVKRQTESDGGLLRAVEELEGRTG